MPTMPVVDVIVEILTDMYSWESSWSLIANEGGESVASGPSASETYAPGSMYTFVVSLTWCALYTLTVNATYGDGLISPGYAEIKVVGTDSEISLGRIDDIFSTRTIEVNVCVKDDS